MGKDHSLSTRLAFLTWAAWVKRRFGSVESWDFWKPLTRRQQNSVASCEMTGNWAGCERGHRFTDFLIAGIGATAGAEFADIVRHEAVERSRRRHRGGCRGAMVQLDRCIGEGMAGAAKSRRADVDSWNDIRGRASGLVFL